MQTYHQRFYSHAARILLLTVILLMYCGCGPQASLQRIDSFDLPLFTDDSDKQALIAAAEKHLVYLRDLPADHQLLISGTSYPLTTLIDSMQLFISHLNEVNDGIELNRRIRDNFMVFQAAGRYGSKEREMLVTGYYEPLFAGSRERIEPYIYPLYSPPGDLVNRISDKDGNREVGRFSADGKLVPFWTRAEIETHDYLKGYELVYLKDPFDAFLLHIQGSGRIRLRDGSILPIRFAAHNGQNYNSIGKLLVDEEKITLKESAIPHIRKYLNMHPEEQVRIFHHNPRYIFFNWGDERGPRGSLDIELTGGRSIAIDKTRLPTELFGYLVSQKPRIDSNKNIIEWLPLGRFVLPQDSGAAIQGTGRVDLFWGSGEYSEISAGNMKEPGKLYFLLSKESVEQLHQ